MVGYRTCLRNLAQHAIEKLFLLLHVWTMSAENFFVVKSEESHKNSIYLFIFLIESNNTTLLNLIIFSED